MALTTYRAKVTRLDSGATVIEPYRETGSRKYQYMLQKDTQLRRTKKDYLVVFRFPRVRGIIAATRQLINECARISLLMYNLYLRHNEQ